MEYLTANYANPKVATFYAALWSTFALPLTAGSGATGLEQEFNSLHAQREACEYHRGARQRQRRRRRLTEPPRPPLDRW